MGAAHPQAPPQARTLTPTPSMSSVSSIDIEKLESFSVVVPHRQNLQKPSRKKLYTILAILFSILFITVISLSIALTVHIRNESLPVTTLDGAGSPGADGHVTR